MRTVCTSEFAEKRRTSN
jgi:MinD-like ATPase involved in chromosome partitioning or flagellar assembly